MDFTDKQMSCGDCQKPFVFTAGEQQWHREKGFDRAPRRCPDCRQARKGHDGVGHGADRSSGGGGGGQARGGRPDRPKFKVKCSQCGTDAEVPFQPRSGAPVFCSSCYQARPA